MFCRYIDVSIVLDLHTSLLERDGGMPGIRDMAGLESALAQPRMTAFGKAAYPTLPTKAAALMFSLINNHPFADGNKRIAHAACETFLVFNGFTLNADVDEQERMVLALASGTFSRQELVRWIRAHVIRLPFAP